MELLRSLGKVLILGWGFLVGKKYYPFKSLFSYHPLCFIAFTISMVFSIAWSMEARLCRNKEKKEGLRVKHMYGMWASGVMYFLGISAIMYNKVVHGKGLLFVSGRMPSNHGWTGVIWGAVMSLTMIMGWMLFTTAKDLPHFALGILKNLGKGKGVATGKVTLRKLHYLLGTAGSTLAFVAGYLGLIKHDLNFESQLLAIVWALLFVPRLLTS